jgi:hypothetical protein
MHREWKKIEFPKQYYVLIWKSQDRGRPRNGWQDELREDGGIVCGEEWQEKVYKRGMEEAPEKGIESYSAHTNGMNE